MARAAERRSEHWSELDERGSEWGPATLAWIYRVFGRPACIVALSPVIVYFWLTGTKQRRASMDYLRRVRAARGFPPPNLLHTLRHFFAFGIALVDKFGAWIGHMERGQVDAIDGKDFNAFRDDTRGTLVMSGHVGATEIVRAMAARYQKRPVTVVIHTRHARKFNKMLERFAPNSMVSLVEASDFGPGEAMRLSAAIERGEWVVIMGDRTPPSRNERTIETSFLGERASFPEGPFVLAAALRCPVYALFCFRVRGRWRTHVSLLGDSIALPRRERRAALERLVRRFAGELEQVALTAPYQWFNFYDFWAPARRTGEDT